MGESQYQRDKGRFDGKELAFPATHKNSILPPQRRQRRHTLLIDLGIVGDTTSIIFLDRSSLHTFTDAKDIKKEKRKCTTA
jgi:hypothetical protein